MSSNTRDVRKKLLDNAIPECCACCGILSEWNGKFLRLQVDHIDGNRFNNAINNLRFLCPNCHTQTTTYGSRNKRSHHPFNVTESPLYKFLDSLTTQQREDYFKSVPTYDICLEFKITPQTISRYKKIFKVLSRYPSRNSKYYVSKPPVSCEQLISDVKNMSMKAVGKKYGVSDNAVRKWCKKYGIDKSIMKFSHKPSAG